MPKNLRFEVKVPPRVRVITGISSDCASRHSSDTIILNINSFIRPERSSLNSIDARITVGCIFYPRF